MKRSKRIKFKNRTPEHKTSAFFSRYIPKKRRRREGKTDYKQRVKLLQIDKNKYNTKKYKLVVRRTNKFITVSLVSYNKEGDKVILSASTAELVNFGLNTGLSSYMAAYCLGKLIAARYSLLDLSSSNSNSEEENSDEEEEEEEG